MSKKGGVLEKIKSKYILNKIFDYIRNENYKLKFLIYSKSLQIKYDLKIEYKYCFLKEYLKVKEFIFLNLINKELDTNYFYKKLNDLLDFIHITHEESKEISEIIYNNYIKEQKKIHKILRYTDFFSTIDIYSPFIECAISNDFHFINIPLDDIEKYYLKNDYISFFKKQNKNHKKMKVLISLKDVSQVDSLKDLNIDSSKINQAVFVYRNKFFYSNFKTEKKDKYLNEIYSLINLPNNLEVLDFYFDKHYSIEDLFFSKWFNCLINLKELKLTGMSFNSKLIISLPKLEIIKLIHCENIDFKHEAIDKNLKYLEIINTKLVSGKPHIFENLEELKISESGYNNFNKIIDFSCLKKLKKYNVSNIYLVEQISFLPLVEEFFFSPNNFFVKEVDKGKLFNSIIQNKTLKKINIELPSAEQYLDKISIINENINDIYFIQENPHDYNIESLLTKFSNIKKLKIEATNGSYNSFSMKEEKKIIIEELELHNPRFGISFSFSYLQSLTLNFTKCNNSYKSFSLFNSNCNTKFSNLESLNISISEEFDMKLLENFASNINYFQNLKKLKFKFYIEDIDEKAYFYFIDKLLSLNLIECYISFDIDGWNKFYKVHFKLYSKRELKKIFPKKIKEDFNYKDKIQRVKTEEEIKEERKEEAEKDKKRKCLSF